MEVEYELSQELMGHEKAARCLCVLADGRIVSGGVDNFVVVWKKEMEGARWEKEKVLEHHSDFIYCLCASSASSGSFFSGGKDKLIFQIDHEGNPILEYKGHEGPVCSVVERGAELISGSWDGTFRVWDTATAAEKQKVEAGTHAVTVACLPTGEIITGSQDKMINFWRGNQKLRSLNAHNDIVRKLSVTGTGFASCSNDQSVKLWTLDGLETAELPGHESFVFDVCYGEDRSTLFSASDDRCVIVWKLEGPTGQRQQSILHANTIWGVNALPSGDIVTACADGIVRVWTRDPERMAGEAERAAQRTGAEQAAAEAQQKSNGAVPLAGVTDVSAMATTPGKKEGEVKMFKDGQNVMAYAWKGGTWDLIGQVTGRPKTAYEGDQFFPAGEYDYVFDVDLGEEKGTKKLPVNEGDNYLVVAEMFVARESVGRYFLSQIEQFIRDNIRGSGGGAQNSSGYSGQQQPKPEAPAAPKPSGYSGKHLPVRQVMLFKDGKFDPLVTKLKEINSGFPEEDTERRCDFNDWSHFDHALEILKTNSFSKDFRACERDIIWKKMGEWPQDKLFPVIDLWRLYLIHPSSGEMFKGTDKGASIIARMLRMLKEDTNGPLGLCCSRFLANLFACSTNKWALYDKRGKVLESLKQIIPQVTNKNVKLGIASTLLNFAIAATEKADASPDGKEDLLQAAALLIPLSGDNPAAQMQAVLAAGTVLVCRGSVDTALKGVAVGCLASPLSSLGGGDPKLAEVVSEVKSLLA